MERKVIEVDGSDDFPDFNLVNFQGCSPWKVTIPILNERLVFQPSFFKGILLLNFRGVHEIF